MPATKLLNDPTLIPDKDRHFINVAKAVAEASLHPIAKGGCLLVRDNEIIGDGRSILAECKVEVDCVTYPIISSLPYELSGSVKVSVDNNILNKRRKV